jgi:hypothetical protein
MILRGEKGFDGAFFSPLFFLLGDWQAARKLTLASLLYYCYCEAII